MPCYAKSTPLGDTRSTEYFVPWQRTKCEGEKGGGVGDKNSLILGKAGGAHSPSRRV